jgi:RNA polymerase sigma factor (sigma-70 family)
VRAVARAHRLSTHEADDVVQTTWLRLCENIAGVHNPTAVGAWLETTARREALRMLRSSKREHPTGAELRADEPVAPVADERLIAAEERAALVAAGERLPLRQRELFALLLTNPDASYDDIGRALDMPQGSIGPTRRRLLDRLRHDRELAGAVGAR